MHVVINIPDRDYKKIKENNALGYFERIIMRGVPLPKGHGPLKDIDWIIDNCKDHHSDEDGSWCITVKDIYDAPPIIGADKE